MSKKVKNFLGKVEEVKAPKRWKSSPDAPTTQLAYITQPEIDMLVKANIHGSMQGKPNMGPKGIISLDGGGSYGIYNLNFFTAGYGNTTSAIDAVQFKMSSGNIDSGQILLFGLN